MRIIIKPAGAALLLLAIGTLVVLLITRGRGPAVAGADGGPGGNLTAGSNAKPAPRPKGSKLIDPTTQPWNLITQKPAEAKMEMFIDAQSPSDNKHAVRLNVSAVDPNKFWCAQLVKKVPDDVKAGRSMEVRFWGKSPTSTPVHVVFEEGVSPHTPEIDEVVSFTPEWKEYSLKFNTRQDHVAVPANFCLKAGIKPGEVMVSDVRVFDLTGG